MYDTQVRAMHESDCQQRYKHVLRENVCRRRTYLQKISQLRTHVIHNISQLIFWLLKRSYIVSRYVEEGPVSRKSSNISHVSVHN